MKLISVLVLILATASFAEELFEEKPTSQPAADLAKNELVQKALADKDKAEALAEAEYQKKLNILNAERQKQFDAAKTTCVASLKRAETVAKALKKMEEAETIKSLAESVREDIITVAALPFVPNKSKQIVFVSDSFGYLRILHFSGKCIAYRLAVNGTWVVKDKKMVSTWENGTADIADMNLRPEATESHAIVKNNGTNFTIRLVK